MKTKTAVVGLLFAIGTSILIGYLVGKAGNPESNSNVSGAAQRDSDSQKQEVLNSGIGTNKDSTVSIEGFWERDPIKNLIDSRKKNRPKFLLTDGEGHLTSQAVNAFRLNSEQEEELKTALSEVRSGIREQLLKNISKDEEKSKPGSTVYRIKPFSAESDLIIGNFINRMSKTVGKAGAIEIAKAIPVEQDAGGFGFYEVVLSVNAPAPEQVEGMTEDEIRKIHSVQYQYRDSETGTEVGGGTSSMSTFNQSFYNLFE